MSVCNVYYRFSCKNSLMDHIHRRSLQIKYHCILCSSRFIFYNPCALLQHARQHFSVTGGKLDLYFVDIGFLPFGVAGLFSDYNKDEEADDVDDDSEIEENISINSRFYSPILEDKGKRTVRFQPKDLLFLSFISNGFSLPLVLKQINRNIAKCKFVTTQLQQNSVVETAITKQIYCTECKKELLESLSEHFLLHNRPFDEQLTCKNCKFIAPSWCSLQAHLRIHEKLSPFVCPECGKCFNNSQLLFDHLRDVCFHLVKRVKFKCVVPKCRKLFTLNRIFAKHFFAHLIPFYYCTECQIYLTQESKDEHNHKECLVKKFECAACKAHLDPNDYVKHIEQHMPNRESFIYVYVCNWCQATFRSTSTYEIHAKKCPKNNFNEIIEQDPDCDISIYPKKQCFAVCLNCKTKSVVEFGVSKLCEKCAENLTILPVERFLKRKNTPEIINKCLLCQNKITQNDFILHGKQCKYNKSTVKITVYDRCKVDNLNTPIKKRKTSIDLTTPPRHYDGVYHCKFCTYTHSNKQMFHDHILMHRATETCYQCMECGDCFVVKLSLMRHLMYFHKIVNADEYFEKNQCFVGMEGVVTNKNECSVCFQEFSDQRELNNHFRVHGMAYLECSVK